MNKSLVLLTGLIATHFTSTASAHFPWLASDEKGKAVFWFGESITERTYHLPEKVAGIQLVPQGADKPVEMEEVDTDDLIGMVSTSPLDREKELAGSVTYGLYHGTKLTYHVEHLPHQSPQDWPSEPRKNADLQTIITSTGNGVSVVVLKHGKPLADVGVKLFCEDGHEEGYGKTDNAGLITFTGNEVESGLNAIMVGVTDGKANGQYEGEAFSSTSDYLTATFFVPGGDSKPAKKKPSTPTVDPNSGASISPSGLPDLPEELTSFGATVTQDQQLFVYGGHTGNAHSYSTTEQSNRLWKLDLSSPQSGWKQVATGPRLQGLALVAYQADLIRIGGFTAMNKVGEDHDLRSQSSVARYLASTGQWEQLPPLPEPRSSFDAAVIGSKVFVAGGWELSGESSESKWHDTAWSLDLSDPSEGWQPLAAPGFQRRAVSVAAHAGRLYVIGGMQAQGGPTTRVDVYDPSADQWTQIDSIPGSGMAGFGTAAFPQSGQLVVSSMDGHVHSLVSPDKKWATIAKADPSRFFHRMLPAGQNQLLMLGGANMEVGKFTEIERIQLASE
ncbi:MAG: kelch repeat-containing protein [Planctomycetota bacterium]